MREAGPGSGERGAGLEQGQSLLLNYSPGKFSPLFPPWPAQRRTDFAVISKGTNTAGTSLGPWCSLKPSAATPKHGSHRLGLSTFASTSRGQATPRSAPVFSQGAPTRRLPRTRAQFAGSNPGSRGAPCLPPYFPVFSAPFSQCNPLGAVCFSPPCRSSPVPCREMRRVPAGDPELGA